MRLEFISPYSFELNIGGAINQAIDHLPDDAWVVHCDHDTLKPPGFAERVHQVLKNPHLKTEFVFTCRTNRVGWGNPLVVEEMFMEENMTAHLRMAKTLWEQHGTTVMPTEVAPGYCMVFNVGHVKRLGGFSPRSIVFDKWLSERSVPMVMEGVYIFHLYRWLKPNPGNSYNHLLIPGSYLK